MLAVISLVLPLFALIFIGYLSARLVRISEDGLAWMNFFIIYIALPPLFFRLLSQTPVEQFANIGFIAVSLLATLLVFVIAFAAGGLRNRGNVAESTIQGFAAAYGNIGYMGPPLVLAAFGPAAGVPVALIFCFENAMHFILAPFLMGVHSGGNTSPLKLAGTVVWRIFTHPFIIATIIGVAAAIMGFVPPQPLDRLITFLANAAAPCALFAMGVTAALRPLKRIPAELSYIVPLKLVIHPLLVYLGLTTFVPGLDRDWLGAAVLLAALPSATNVFVIAQQYRVWQERASACVVVSTVFAMASVTIIIYLFREGII